MKKSSLFIIIVVFLVSIVAITFFGQSIEMGQFKVYVTDLEITNETELIGDDIRNINLTWNEEKGWTSVFVNYTYLPSDATDPSVSYYLDGAVRTDATTGEEVTVAEVFETTGTAEVVFYRQGYVTCYLTTKDGSNITDSVRITCR